LEEIQDIAISIVAFFGCLRSCELVAIEKDDIECVSEGIMIKITRFKTTNKSSRFLIPNTLEKSSVSPSALLRKYLDVVLPWLTKKSLTRFWPRPTKSGFSAQFRGINYVGTVAKKIATFLQLDPSSFTGHSFRRSSATSAADGGISLINLKRFGGWRSDSVASSYVDDSRATAVEAAACLVPQSVDKEEETLPPICSALKENIAASSSMGAKILTSTSNKQGQFVFNIVVNQK
jgi:integrase